MFRVNIYVEASGTYEKVLVSKFVRHGGMPNTFSTQNVK